MARIHFISGEKGGVGKSFTARVLSQYLIDNNMPFCGYDSDQSHGTFSRFYNEYTTPVVVEDFESLDQILISAEDTPEQDIVVDMAAQTGKYLDAWVNESDLFGILDDIGAQVFIWHVMDDGADSARLLEALLDKYGEIPLQFVVVKNMGRGNNFSFFDKSEIFKKAQEFGTIFITLPQLAPGLAQKVDFYNFSFWAAGNNPKAMTTVERKRMKVWLENCFSKFSRFLKPLKLVKNTAE